MLTLIKRELSDSLPVVATLFCLVALLSIVSTVILASYYQDASPPVGIPVGLVAWFHLVLFGIPLIFTVLGQSQMRTDQKNKISTFLCTLASSRQRIYLARIATGLLCIVLTTLLTIITVVVGFKLYPRVIPLDADYLWHMAAILFCLSGACYAVGLQLAWSPNRFLPALGGLFLTLLILSLVGVKGIGNIAIGLLLCIALASFIRGWHNYESTAL